MVDPTLWGPGMWHLLFATARGASHARVAEVTRLCMVLTPLLIPCDLCREHFAANARNATRKTRGVPKTAEDVFRWLFYLKDGVNRSTRSRSIPLHDLERRYELHGNVVNDVLVADTLVLLALHASSQGDGATLVEFARLLGQDLPLPEDSELKAVLGSFHEPVLHAAYAASKNARLERGVVAVPLEVFRRMSEED